jgi:hypothetical protein
MRLGGGKGGRPSGVKRSPPASPARGRRTKRKQANFKQKPTGSNSTGGRQRNVRHPQGTEHTIGGKLGKRQTRRINKPQQPPRGRGGR